MYKSTSSYFQNYSGEEEIPGNSYSRNSIRQGMPQSGQSYFSGPNQTITSGNRNMNIVYSPPTKESSNKNAFGISSVGSRDKVSEAATSRPSILKRPYESELASDQRSSMHSSSTTASMLRTINNRLGDERSDSNSKSSLVPRMNTVKPTKVPLPVKSSKKANDDAKCNAISVEDDEEDDDVDDMCNESQCKLCNVTFESENAYHVHIRLTSHLQKSMLYKEKRLSSSCVQNVTLNELHCNICNFTFSSKQVFNCHLHGLAHQAGLKQIKEAHDKKMKEKEKQDLISKLKQEAKLTRNKQHVEALEFLEANNLIEEDMVFGNDIFCKVCQVKCSGFISYKNHLDGVKHKKKLKLIGSGYPTESDNGSCKNGYNRIIVPGKDLWVEDMLAKCKEPLIGIDYMTEYQSKEPDQEPRYLCDLCMSKMDVRQVINHLTGINHRQKYFKYHDPSKYSYLWPMTPKSSKVAKARVFAAEVERREGRHRMRIKVQVQPFKACTESDEWVEVPGSRSRSAKELPGIKSAFTSDDTRYTTFDGDDEDDFEDHALCPANKPVVADYGHRSGNSQRALPKPVDVAPKSAYFYNCNFDFKQGTSYNCFEENRSSDKNQRMVREGVIKDAIVKCNMDLECDAEAALHISNAITQGLLEYKLQTDNESSELREQFEALKRQNASSFAENITNPVMSMALKEAQYMARLLPFGDEALFASAMSILDSLNNKLYMLMEKSKEEDDQTDAESSKNSNALPPNDGVFRFKMRSDQTPKRFKFGL